MRYGTRILVTHQGVTATATYISGWHDLRAVVRLDGTEQVVTIPRSWIRPL